MFLFNLNVQLHVQKCLLLYTQTHHLCREQCTWSPFQPVCGLSHDNVVTMCRDTEDA